MPDYSRVAFVKISNNNNPKEFWIDITTMKDARQRIGSLKTQYRNYIENQLGKYKPVYKLLEGDWSYVIQEKGSYDNYDDVKMRRLQIYKELTEKWKNVILDNNGGWNIKG